MLPYLPNVSQLSNIVIRVLGGNPGIMTLQGTNTYIVGNGEKRILIDVGDGARNEYFESLISIMKQFHFSFSDIIITHHHSDHIGGLVPFLENVTKCVRIHKFPLPGEIYDSFEVSPLHNGQVLEVDGASLSVLHTPGHTSDHISLFLKEENALFGGDLILGEGSSVFENYTDYMASLDSLLSFISERIYPGHGSLILDSKSKIESIIFHRHERERQILSVLSDGSSYHLKQLVKMIYKETPVNLHEAAAKNMEQYLSKLIADKKVTNDKENHVFRLSESLT